jgi:hypothetical protein
MSICHDNAVGAAAHHAMSAYRHASMCHAEVSSNLPHVNAAFAAPSPTASSASGSAGTPAAVALALGGWQPYKVAVVAGIAKILVLMHSPMIAQRCNAPFSSVLGQSNAVALSMVPFGLLLWILGAVIVKRRWHETQLGLTLIVIGSFTCIGLLTAFA